MPRPDCPSVSTETPTQVSNIRPKALCSTGEFAVFAGDVRLQVRRAQPALKLDSRPGPNAIIINLVAVVKAFPSSAVLFIRINANMKT